LSLKISSFLAVGASLGTLMIASPLAAQSVGSGQGVADRGRPDYDPIGAPVGSFRLFPSVTTTVQATDNYLAQNEKRGDVFVTIAPEVVAQSDWARNRVEARVFADQSLHAKLTGENITQYGGSVSGAYDVSREMQFRADASAGQFVESRSSLGSFQGASEPVQYRVLHGGVGVSRSVNELVVNADASVNYQNYKDVEANDGTTIDQDFRDVRSVLAGGSVKYDLRNGIGLIVSGQYINDLYSLRPGRGGFAPSRNVDRSSSGFNLQGGITLELTRLVFGNIQVGYLSRKYKDERLSNVGGLSYNADILWNVTPLTSIRARASRSVEDTSSLLFAGNTRSDFRLSADHELYRYIILSGDVSFGTFKPNGVGIGGNEYSAGAGARYLIDRRFSVTGNLRYSARTSDSSFIRYNATSASVGLRVAF
jgi:hypothetical protein